MKCKKCKTKLIFVPSFGWVHPRSDCTELDGIIVDDKTRDVWNKEYPENIGVSIINQLKLENLELEEGIKSYQKQHNDLENEFNLLAKQYEELNNLWQSTFDFRITMWIAYVKYWFKHGGKKNDAIMVTD